jgi:NADH-quinone oxidoreductase subunit G
VQDAKASGKVLIAQVAPAVRVAVGEPFGGASVRPEQIVTCLRRLGFDYVFDTLLCADSTIVEEGTEMLAQLRKGRPLFTSCCPGWMQFVGAACDDLRPFISTSKSPMMMMGSLVKSYFAERVGIRPEDIFHVAFMPCVKKQAEADQPGIDSNPGRYKDVDLVITTLELADLIKADGVTDLAAQPASPFDNPMGAGSGGSALFGRTGGVMLAALRFAHHALTGGSRELPPVVWTSVAEVPGVREATLAVPEAPSGEIRVAVVVGLADAKKYVAAFREGRVRHDFVEVMACFPGGCISGGGQPLVGKNKGLVDQRRRAMDAFDDGKGAHDNPLIDLLYRDYVGEPMGDRAHRLLHRTDVGEHVDRDHDHDHDHDPVDSNGNGNVNI